MSRLHLQLALDLLPLDEAVAIARRAIPYVNTIEVGTPLLIREGVAAIRRLRAELSDVPQIALMADTKISDEGAEIGRLCFEAGADGLTVVDGASTATLQAVYEVANAQGKQVWVDLLYHSNPIIRAHAIAPYVDGFLFHRPPSGFPPLLVDGLLALDRPIRLAGGMDLDLAHRARRIWTEAASRETMLPQEGFVIGRAITQAEDVEAALRAFADLCELDAFAPQENTL